jgi:hypothetical protein
MDVASAARRRRHPVVDHQLEFARVVPCANTPTRCR